MKNYLLALLVLTVSAAAQQMDHDHEHVNHGFVLIANDPPVLYHLARFNSPHRYQGLFGVSIRDEQGKEIDLKTVKSTRGILSVVSTTPFQLEDDLAGDKPLTFSAELYDGYLRGPDKALIGKITVERLTTIYFEELSTIPSPDPKTRLITFCHPLTNRFYAAHLVEGSPNFEELLSIEALYSGATGEVSVVYPCTMNHVGEILTIVNRPGDKPLKDTSYLDAYSPALGHVVSLSIVRRLLLDEKAINGIK